MNTFYFLFHFAINKDMAMYYKKISKILCPNLRSIGANLRRYVCNPYYSNILFCSEFKNILVFKVDANYNSKPSFKNCEEKIMCTLKMSNKLVFLIICFYMFIVYNFSFDF